MLPVNICGCWAVILCWENSYLLRLPKYVCLCLPLSHFPSTRCVRKVPGLSVLCELWVEWRSTVASMYDVIFNEHITAIPALWIHCTFFSQAHVNGYLNFTRQAMTTKQRINLKFLVRLGKTPSDALGMLQEVYGDGTMSRSRVFEWHKRFKEGCEDVKTTLGVEGLQRAGLRTIMSTWSRWCVVIIGWLFKW